MLPFLKMHGLGNDFVVLDNRDDFLTLSPSRIRRLSHRREGIGCDQVIVLQPSSCSEADVFMGIYNSDGTEVEACGNGARCVAMLIQEERKQDECVIETLGGLWYAQKDGPNRITVILPPPSMDWEKIPLTECVDTLHLPITQGILQDPVAVNVGNPHMIFFVQDADGIDLHNVGFKLTTHPLYKDGANVNIAEVIDRQNLKLRVYERGVGPTSACGTGACATVVAGISRGLLDSHVVVQQMGGDLAISYDGEKLSMGGDVALSFRGTLDPTLWGDA
jgi:diaminopimelate epimerase